MRRLLGLAKVYLSSFQFLNALLLNHTNASDTEMNMQTLLLMGLPRPHPLDYPIYTMLSIQLVYLILIKLSKICMSEMLVMCKDEVIQS